MSWTFSSHFIIPLFCSTQSWYFCGCFAARSASLRHFSYAPQIYINLCKFKLSQYMLEKYKKRVSEQVNIEICINIFHVLCSCCCHCYVVRNNAGWITSLKKEKKGSVATYPCKTVYILKLNLLISSKLRIEK